MGWAGPFSQDIKPRFSSSSTYYAISKLTDVSLYSTLVFVALVVVAQAQSLNVVNKCTETALLYTQTSYGSIQNNVNVAAGGSHNMGISSQLGRHHQRR